MPSGQYLTYDEYKGYGGDADATAFPTLEMMARKRIDYLTACRVQHMAVVPEAVKLCIVALTKVENSAGAVAQATNPTVTSFNTDGYSESYGNALNADSAEKQMNKLIRKFLWGEKDDNGVFLLYRGLVW